MPQFPKMGDALAPERIPLRTFRSGSQFVRVFDIVKAELHGYSGCDFNPTRVQDEPDVRGRFSARMIDDDADLVVESYSYLYLGEQKVDERTAFLECIDLLSLPISPRNGMFEVSHSLLRDLGFAYAELQRNATLVDVNIIHIYNIYNR